MSALWQCETCNAPIGYIGRAFQWLGLRVHKCPQDQLAQRMEQLATQSAQWRAEILRSGGATLDPYSNVAPGSYGYEVLRMEFEGILSKPEIERWGPLPTEYLSRYSLSPLGRTVVN